jgi:hypothetical protein
VQLEDVPGPGIQVQVEVEKEKGLDSELMGIKILVDTFSVRLEEVSGYAGPDGAQTSANNGQKLSRSGSISPAHSFHEVHRLSINNLPLSSSSTSSSGGRPCSHPTATQRKGEEDGRPSHTCCLSASRCRWLF